MDAAELWAGRRLDDPLPPPPLGARAPRHSACASPGRHVPWGAQLPARFGIDPHRVDELAEDAVDRAWRMLVDDQPSGLRRAAAGRPGPTRRVAPASSITELAARAGVTPGRLRTWADAWLIGGDTAVVVVAEPDSWSTDQRRLDDGREQSGRAGPPATLGRAQLRQPADGVHASGWCIGPDGRWYRLHGAGKHQDLRLAAAPSHDIRDLVDPPESTEAPCRLRRW